MYKNKRILALIPARGGSKGIKDKNIIELFGKPLIAYSIDAAKNSKYIDGILVSTDSEKIAEVSKKYGASVPFLRPYELATDTATTLDVVLHAINYVNKEEKKYDTLILLQPTAPLRKTEDIDSAIEKFFLFDEKSLVSVSEVDDNPILIRMIDDNERLKPLINQNSTCRRQDMPVYYRINGCIYINNIADLDENTSFNDNEISYIMSKEHSVDIDEYRDLCVAEYYLKRDI